MAAAAAAAAASTAWQPAALDAEFSAQVAELLRTDDGRRALSSRVRRRDEGLRAAVKKHLLALGWTILCRPNAAMLTRLRYEAPGPGNKSYCSLPDLIIDSAAASHLVAVADEPAAPAAAVEEDDIGEYIALMATNDRARGRRANRLRDSAKRHLLAAGWTFWMKHKSSGKEELRYKAPTGRSYISLHTACQAFKTAAAGNARLRGHCRPVVVHQQMREKRKLSELLGDVNVTMKTSIKKKCRVDGTQVMKKSITTTTLTCSCRKKKKKKKKKKQRQQEEARVLLRPNTERRSRTLLSVLIDRGIVVPRDKVTCRDGAAAKHKRGFITGEGIRCTCCNNTLTVAEFEAHATGTAAVRVVGQEAISSWARVLLDKDGTSLSQCLVELMRRDVGVVAARNSSVRVKEKCSDPEGDSVCSICNHGGDLLLCDNCPSAFHHACVGLQATPEGHWFCPSCRCTVCGGTDFDATGSFTDKTIIYCDQCEREYHVGCVRRRRGSKEEEQQNWCRPWLCSRECGEVFEHLQGLARAGPIPTAVQGVSLNILRRRRRRRQEHEHDDETDAAEHAQLCAALDVLHECFMTLMEPRTQTDLTADIVFNRESELRRLNFRGYYVVGLQKAGELITVATLRVLGTHLAELPLVGTRFAHRRQGMCHLLLTELHKLLRQLGVRSLVLPAVPDLLPMWTASLGFHPMTHSQVMQIAADHAILTFQGTTMCQKTLLP